MENDFFWPIIIIDVLILAVSVLFYVFPPKKINSWYGYRTASAMKNPTNWEAAQRLSKKFILYFSIAILVVQIPILFYFQKFSLIITCFLWVLSLVLTLGLVEKKLKKMSE